MIKPLLIGALMAAMMLWMVHEPIISGTANLTTATLAFVAAHLAVAFLILSLALFSPRIRQAVRHHRPNAKHMLAMGAGMLVTAATIHLTLHQGVF